MFASDSVRHDPHSTNALVRRLVREHVRHHLPHLVIAVICMGLVAAATAANAWLMQPALDDVFIRKDRTLLYIVPAAILGLALFKGFASYFQAVLMEYVGQRIVANLQTTMYARLITADLAFFHDNATGKLISRFTNDANMVRMTVIRSLTGLVKDVLMLAFLVALMFYQDWLMALIAFVAFPLSIYPIVRIGKSMRKVSTATQVEMAELTTLLDETFQGARLVKAYGMEGYETARAGSIIEKLYRLICKSARVRSSTRPVMETLGGIAVAAVVLYGGNQVIQGATTPGTFFSFVTALLLAYQPLKNIANLNANLQQGLAAAQRLFAVLDVRSSINDKPDAGPLQVTTGTITFDDVAFRYVDGVPALEGVDLEVPGGQTVALVGPSGAGKSTILNLIPRFYDAGRGSVRIDGTDVRDVTLSSLRANVALVSQEITLFDDSVRANIAYGRLGADEAAIVEAARNAGAHDFIMALPDGYDTDVGTRGVRLSGGERQRLAIARAMLKDAPILLLDEATSSLDTESEHQVRAALARLKKGRTTLVIAHRLSTVVDADRICVIDGGRVVESGSHGELMLRKGAYARLYALQFAAEGEPGRPVPAAVQV